MYSSDRCNRLKMIIKCNLNDTKAYKKMEL